LHINETQYTCQRNRQIIRFLADFSQSANRRKSMQGIRSDGGDLIPLQMAAKEKQGVRRASEILDKQA
jgi:hypothetical protein